MQAFFARTGKMNLHVIDTAEEAFEHIAQQRTDIILMDINLSGMSGSSQATEKLKSDANYKNIPIIALSAAAMKHDIEELETIFDAYITKPVDYDLLMAEINRHLGKQHNE